MRYFFLLIPLLFIQNALAQPLSSVAQTLYDTTFNQDVFRGNYALSNGATFHSSPDSSSFYLQWFPNSSTQPDTLPMIVTCHGSEGKVFDEFFLWHPYAVANSCGIIAVQWYNPDSTVWFNDPYLKDTTIYNTIESALSSLGYPSGKALFHGFSRGSARSYAINLYDVLSGNNYFCTTISNAGSAEPAYPLYHDIDLGMYGPTPFLGKHWALYCGELDPNSLLSGCLGMSNTKNWLMAKGADVDIFIQDPSGLHGGFHMNSANVDSVLAYYLQCFDATLYVENSIGDNSFSIYPNPTNGTVFIKTPVNVIGKNCWIEFYDELGKLVCTKKLDEELITAAELRRGNYYYVIVNDELQLKRGRITVL